MSKRLVLTFSALSAILWGCSGDSGTTNVVPANATLTTYATDSLSTDFDNVWVRLHSITLEGNATTRTLFEDQAGMVVDLKSLRDGTGPRYMFLEQVGLQAGQYSTLRVEMAEQLAVVPIGTLTAQNRLFAAAHAKPGSPGRSEFRLPLNLTVGAGENTLVVDFDLANWNLDANGRVTAILRRGDGNGIGGHDRHEFGDLRGNVANLSGTAPNQTFELRRGQRAITVRTDANTTIFLESGGINPRLVNDAFVQVRGKFVNRVFLASTVMIDDDQTGAPHHVSGVASNIDTNQGTFTLTARRCFGFLPGRLTFNVATNQNTKFLLDSGGATSSVNFFAALQALGATGRVEAVGTITGTTFNARLLKIEDSERNHVDIRGSLSEINGAAGTFRITVQEWEGANLSAGQVVSVTTNGQTVFQMGDAIVTPEIFFTNVNGSSRIMVRGAYNGNVLTAARVHTLP